MQKPRYMIELRSAIVAGVVAVLVAAPLSDAAYTQAGHVIKIVKGERGKTGKRGPRGFRGPTGATGPQGERGPAGKDAPTGPAPISSPADLEAHGTALVAGVCPAGEFATGGAVSAPGAVVQWERVFDSGAGYLARVANPTASAVSVTVTPACLPI